MSSFKKGQIFFENLLKQDKKNLRISQKNGQFCPDFSKTGLKTIIFFNFF